MDGTWRLVEKHSRRCLLRELHFATAFVHRLVGLIGRRTVADGYGLYFPRCSAIHTCFMRFALDIIYVDSARTVLKTVRDLKPWRLSCCPGAAGVIETASGWIERHAITPGMELLFVESGDEP